MDGVLQQLIQYDNLSNDQFELFLNQCRQTKLLRMLVRWGLFSFSLSQTVTKNDQCAKDAKDIQNMLKAIVENYGDGEEKQLLFDPKLKSLNKDIHLYICQFLDGRSHRCFLLVNKYICSNISSRGLFYLHGDWFYDFWRYTHRTEQAKIMQIQTWKHVKSLNLEEFSLDTLTSDGVETQLIPFKKMTSLFIADVNDYNTFLKKYTKYFQSLYTLKLLQLPPKMKPKILSEMNAVLRMMTINHNINTLTMNEFLLFCPNEVINSADFEILKQLQRLHTFVINGFGNGNGKQFVTKALTYLPPLKALHTSFGVFTIQTHLLQELCLHITKQNLIDTTTMLIQIISPETRVKTLKISTTLKLFQLANANASNMYKKSWHKISTALDNCINPNSRVSHIQISGDDGTLLTYMANSQQFSAPYKSIRFIFGGWARHANGDNIMIEMIRFMIRLKHSCYNFMIQCRSPGNVDIQLQSDTKTKYLDLNVRCDRGYDRFADVYTISSALCRLQPQLTSSETCHMCDVSFPYV
eukprot:50075_1